MTSIFGVGPTPATFPRLPANDGHSSSGRMSALALAADGNRIYAGSLAGLWRSEDAGEHWIQLTRPQPSAGSPQGDIAGALYAPHVLDIAASPSDPNLVLVSARDSQFLDGRDGIYRSTDAGATWTLVLKSTSFPTTTSFNIVFAPDDPSLVYAAGSAVLFSSAVQGIFAVSRDAGATWTTTTVGRSLWHLAVGPLEAGGVRRIYAIGDSVVWYSTDGGATWRMDNGVALITQTRQQLETFQKTCNPKARIGGFGGQIAGAVGDAAQILAVEPGTPSRVYLATAGGAIGPTYYSDKVPDGTLVNSDCRRLAGEASLWLGDFGAFESSGRAQWFLLPGPPVYTNVTTPSGNRYVVTKPTSSGFLLFFADNSHVHVSAGRPATSTAWHRLDGMDASEAYRESKKNTLFMHADPHAIAFTPDFEITLKPSGEDAPYNLNSELDSHIAGRLWMANDGGVYWCDDGGRSESSWNIPDGIDTLDGVNIAGLFGHGTTPALYMGCGDNNDFFTLDGGAHWGDPHSNCGDCDAWFTDNATLDWVLQFLPRKGDGVIGIVAGGGSDYPDAGDGGSKTFAPSPKIIDFGDATKMSPCATSAVYLAGYRPLIKTLATEAPPTDADVVIVEQAPDGTAILLRATAIRAVKTLDDWHDTAKAQQIGPTLPPGAVIVQAAGGHARPAFFVASRSGTVWRLNDAHTQWDMIVPRTLAVGTSVKQALQWFVDPYDANGIYVLDSEGVKLSVDGGDSWFFDTGMTDALTAGGKLKISKSLLQDMQFSRGERQTRFAMGTAGVLCTMDFGVFWFPVLNSIALPGRPESGFFDPLSNQSDRAFYVECEGRSILRIGGLPALPPFQPGQPIDLMTFAALEY